MIKLSLRCIGDPVLSPGNSFTLTRK